MDGQFWDWSCETYAKPGVQDALLSLQDEEGLDVNLVLLCGWLASRGEALGETGVARAFKISDLFSKGVTGDIRQLRRAAGAADNLDLKKSLLAAELASEKAQQFWLESLPRRTSDAGFASQLRDLYPKLKADAQIQSLAKLISRADAPGYDAHKGSRV